MTISFKTEIKVTDAQKIKIEQTLGVCRYLQNLYIETSTRFYKFTGKFLKAYTFDKWYKHYFMKMYGKKWIGDVSSKSRIQAIRDIEHGYIQFFKRNNTRPPKYKRKKDNNISMYFVREGKTRPIKCDRHRIKIPTLGWVQLKEKGYIPTEHNVLLSGRITKQAGRYFVTVILGEKPEVPSIVNYTEPVGVDLGIANTAVVSEGDVYDNINYTDTIKRLERQLRRQQRKLSRKYESLKGQKNKRRGGTVTYKNINKQLLKVQKLHKRLTDLRNDYQNKVVSEIVRTKPSSITLEDLNIKGMLKNKHLAKGIRDQRLYAFKEKLISKSKEHGIEVREVDRFYPSSKLCSSCGNKKKYLNLGERIYKCNSCGLSIDRDLNASINLKNATDYIIL